jgi:hypothetical protein
MLPGVGDSGNCVSGDLASAPEREYAGYGMVRFFIPLLLIPAALAAEPDRLSFCVFGPRDRVVDGKHQGCDGPAWVQSTEWECVPESSVREKVALFRAQVLSSGANECERHCQNRGLNCHGQFQEQPKTELQTSDPADARDVGKEFGCGPSCPGKSFAYFALYDLGYRTTEIKTVTKFPADCTCRENH